MTDTKDLFRSLDAVTAPDVWDRVGEPPTRRPIEHEPHRRRPLLAAVAALLVTGLIVGVLVVAFDSGDAPIPGGTVSATDLAVLVEATGQLEEADARLQSAIESDNDDKVAAERERVDEAIAQLRALEQAAPDPKVGVNSPVEHQIAALVMAKARTTVEWAKVGAFGGLKDQAERDALTAQLEAIGAAIEDRCPQVDPDFAEAAGCDVADDSVVESGGTYLLSDFSLTFPVQSDAPGHDVLYAEVSFRTEWSSASWPGEADCEFRLLDRAGEVVASETMGFSVDGPVSDRTRVSVEVPKDAKTPVGAEGDCGPGMVFDGSSQYDFSNMVVDDGRILGDVRWSAGTPVGYAACAFLVSGPDESVRFTVIGLGVGEGQGQVLGKVGDAWPEDGTVQAQCEPYRSPDQFKADYWLPWAGAAS